VARSIKRPLTVAQRAAAACLSKKATDIVIVDLRKIRTAFADYFVICSCDSDTQVRAVSGAVQQQLKEVEVAPFHVEGMSVGQWVLIDYVDVIVHVFHRTARMYYNLERLWGDGKITHVKDDYILDENFIGAPEDSLEEEEPPIAIPIVKKPAIKKPAVKKPAVKKPVVKKPAAKKPAVKKPAAKKPAGVKSGKVKK
jgi:ribosome-associated protein